MSVTIKNFTGGVGNCLFTYVAARYIADRNNLFLDTEWPHNDFIKILPWPNSGKKITYPIVNICDTSGREVLQNDVLNKFFENFHVVIDGYFQNAMFFNDAREKIRSWFEPCTVEQNTKDWVLHYRVGDYHLDCVNSVISPDWYFNVLDKYYDDGTIFIVTNDPKDSCVIKLKEKVGAYIISNDPRSDFNFISSFKKIICSNSSFAWWASFLGNPEACFTFKPWMRYSPRNLALMIGATPLDGHFIK
jgi:Glycosyl transferase family 11.